MELDFGMALGATDESSGQRLTLYIPNMDKEGNVLADHSVWCKQAQELLTEIGKGATAFPPVD